MEIQDITNKIIRNDLTVISLAMLQKIDKKFIKILA